MKKLKRISALLGVFILIAMYLCTLIFALIDSPVASDLLKASIAATIFVPVILYGLLLVTRLLKDRIYSPGDMRSCFPGFYCLSPLQIFFHG